jgi:hypothetical protein
LPTFQQKLEKRIDETHLTGAPVIKVVIVVVHSSLGNDTNENKENDSGKNCKKQDIKIMKICNWLLKTSMAQK